MMMSGLGLARGVLFAGLAVTGLVASSPAYADREVTDLTFFTSPSGNLGCVIGPAGVVGNPVPYVRCDIRQRDWTPPPQPPDCPPDTGYGQGIEVSAGSPAVFVCAGDTSFSNDPALPYGDSISAGVIHCTSMESGMKCRDTQTGHGFSIARQGYQLF